MASDEADANVGNSDNENQEKPVREQLKKTSIDAGKTLQTASSARRSTTPERELVAEDVDMKTPATQTALQKKRSFEGEHNGNKQHRRKRSRDSAAEDDEYNRGSRAASGELSDGAHDADERNGSGAVRPSTPDAAAATQIASGVDELASPRTKKTRLHSNPADPAGGIANVSRTTVPIDDGTKPDEAVTGAALVPENAAASTSVPGDADDKTASRSETNGIKSADDKLAADMTARTTSIPASSSFANHSVPSGFGSVSRSKSPNVDPPQTSPAAFASSGFGALSSTAASGFGAVGKSSGGFGSGGNFASGFKSSSSTITQDKKDTSNETKSAFGGSLGQSSGFASTPSAFGSSATGFGTLGKSTSIGLGSGFGTGASGFGSLAGSSSGGLNSFASGKPSAFTSTKGTAILGTKVDSKSEDEEAGSDDEPSGIKSPLASTPDKQDERFFEQEVETGEEGEQTEYTCRAKLYNYVVVDGKKEWRERGNGVLRLNVKHRSADDDTEDPPPQARLLMRADGSHRVLLNTPVQKSITIGNVGGGPPVNGALLFMGRMADASQTKTGLELLQLRVKQVYALDLYEKIQDLQKEM